MHKFREKEIILYNLGLIKDIANYILNIEFRIPPIDFIYLSMEERRKFAEFPRTYLIEQI